MSSNLLTELQDEKQRCRTIESVECEEQMQAHRARQRVIDLTKRLAEITSEPSRVISDTAGKHIFNF